MNYTLVIESVVSEEVDNLAQVINIIFVPLITTFFICLCCLCVWSGRRRDEVDVLDADAVLEEEKKERTTTDDPVTDLPV